MTAGLELMTTGVRILRYATSFHQSDSWDKVVYSQQGSEQQASYKRERNSGHGLGIIQWKTNGYKQCSRQLPFWRIIRMKTSQIWTDCKYQPYLIHGQTILYGVMMNCHHPGRFTLKMFCKILLNLCSPNRSTYLNRNVSLHVSSVWISS